MLLRVVVILGFTRLVQTFTNCPIGCDCLPDPLVSSTLLYSCRWSSFPTDLLFKSVSDVRSLQIICEGNFTLTPDIFRSLTGLQHLRIERCPFVDLPSSLLKELTGLRSLYLQQVSAIDQPFFISDDSISALTRLEKFTVVDTNLRQLPKRIFCSLKNLQVLNVSSNWMTSLSTDGSCIANQLIIVDFSRNKIEKIGVELHSLPAVRQLSLAHNQISSISASALLKNSLLQQLDLDDNNLQIIEGLPETLIHVNMAYNHLKMIPKDITSLPRTVSLNLSHNDIQKISTPISSTDLESLDLSFNKVEVFPTRSIPKASNNIVHLNLENNNIVDLKPFELANYTKLKSLNLASNSLRVLRDDVFSGLHELSSLDLRNNSLDTLEPGVFADLAIGYIDMSNNHFTEVPIAIGRLFKLKKVDLSYNKISKLYQFIFNKIPHLHSIDLRHNELQSIGPYIFSDCAHLAFLDLSHNQISLLFRDTFIKCPQLKNINLSNNRIVSFEEALVQASAVRRLDLSRNRIELLQWEGLPPKLDYLIADNNRISFLGAALKSKLRTASLRHNRIDKLTSDQVPNTLETLDISNNRISHIGKGTFYAKTNLKSVNFTANALTSVDIECLEVMDGIHPVDVTLKENPLQCTCEMDWIKNSVLKPKVNVISIEDTKCSHIITKKLITFDQIERKELLCNYSQICEPDCVCCQYGNCDCKAVCPDGCSCYRDALFTSNIVRCENLTGIQMQAFSPSLIPVSATHIILSGLSLPILRSHSFLGRMRLEHLYINSSGIRNIQAKAFNTLPALKLLDLSDNLIVKLSGDEFHKSSGISHLFLNGNDLRTIERGLINKLPALKMVTLHNNQLLDVSPALSSSNILSLSLAGNPFRCDCSLRFSAPHWIYANRGKIIDADRIVCVENVTESFKNNDTTVLSAYPPNVGHDVFTMPMNEFLRDYNRTICAPMSSGFFGQEPQNSILFVVFLAACAFLLCAMILLGVSLVRKTHNAMSQRRYKASSSLNCSSTTPGSSPLPVPLINFDAFVSYSKKDEKMIMDQLCRPLEDEEFSLCLLHRDGPIYNSRLHAISDELISQMEASQCLIIVLTRNFLENEWKTLQVKTSHQLFAKNRSKRLIAVLEDGVDQNLLDDELGQMLRKNTCIRMRDHLFWNLLRSALPARMSPPPSDSSQIYSDMYGIVPSAVI